MAASDIEICNLALSHLAGNLIISLDDNSVEAILCKANYDMSRRAVLEEREWTFAVQRAVLPPLSSKPPFGYQFEFLTPPDLLYSIGVYNPSTNNNRHADQTPHVFEGNKILASIAEINIKYVFDLKNTNKFSPLFDQTLAAHLAMNIAIPLTENKGLFDMMAKLYLFNLNNAIASNGMQGTRERLVRSQMEKSRRVFSGVD